jgi:hypothetical protein
MIAVAAQVDIGTPCSAGIAFMIGKIFMSLSSPHPPRRAACWSSVALIFDEEHAAPGALSPD